MPNNCLSVLYKHIIQVENKNVGLKVCEGGGGGGAQTYHCPPMKVAGVGVGGWGTCPPCPPPPPPLPMPVIYIYISLACVCANVLLLGVYMRIFLFN